MEVLVWRLCGRGTSRSQGDVIDFDFGRQVSGVQPAAATEDRQVPDCQKTAGATSRELKYQFAMVGS